MGGFLVAQAVLLGGFLGALGRDRSEEELIMSS
jgi:hypothetical protein